MSRGKGERTPALVNYASARGPIELRPCVIFQATARRFVPRAPIRSVLCKGAWNISRVANRALRLWPRRARLSSRPAVKRALRRVTERTCVFSANARREVNFSAKGRRELASRSRRVRNLFIAGCLVCIIDPRQSPDHFCANHWNKNVDSYALIARFWARGEETSFRFTLSMNKSPEPVVPIVPEYDKFFPRREKGSLHPQ